MSSDNIDIKKLTAQDLDQYNGLLRYAFQVTEKTLLESGWEDEDIKQSKFPVLERANVWGCFDEGELVSQFAVYPLDMNIHSVVYPIAFITSVSTYPEYSGMGLMSQLMKKGLREMRDNGQSLSLLYPYSIPLYRKKGWEIISDKMSFTIRDVQLPKNIEVPGYVRRVSWEDSDFMDLHTQFAKQTHGCLFRNNLAWDEYWKWDEDDTTVAIYYREDDLPRGYMVYLIKDDVMYIKEMIYLDMESRKGLWKYIGAHESMVSEVRGYNYFSEPIAFSFDDSEIKETIRPYIMGRIVDTKMFLEKYRFRGEAEGDVTLRISDSFLEWNDQSLTLDIFGGKCGITNAISRRHASMSIGTLTTLLLGYKRASELAELERIEADRETIKFLDNAVIHKKPYISDYI
ncbi:GNAT family N-acetyltransferase [Cloacibacillus porcorum]|uniref:GNAT family N-acetyltransferase n=1 Tax=Cloacibacillus porcorum TaxID=1197717 RepID=A0A1B2I1I5_9BACT|nr:GNAT family N-acetyltransferase [Cloacibacillus porcorum]ANZ43838.1 GNAT family N-acetyltransferase [Cloacibacillus porcorum]MCI5863696.1 GNAT family N-acetyltransferase [Cloacibacillus porcorum]